MWSKLAAHQGVDARFKTEGVRRTLLVASEALFDNAEAFTDREALLEARRKAVVVAMKRLATDVAEAGAPQPVPARIRALWSKDGLQAPRVEEIRSNPDGNLVKLSVLRPDTPEKLPCVVYLHGGGMANSSAFDPVYQVFGRMIAKHGLACVVLVDFRNCELATESNPQVAPFPAGLNDCFSGLEWVHQHKAELGIDDRIIVAGESGGGNLTIAVALKAKREGRTDLIRHGFYSMCPYIAGFWPQDERNTDRLGVSHLDEENNNILLPLPHNHNVALSYGMEAFEAKNPLAWPSFATVDDLRGLPRCVITVNEFDPLRDEGLKFADKLRRAEVPCITKTVHGTIHGAELMVAAVPDLTLDAVRAIGAFAASPLEGGKL